MPIKGDAFARHEVSSVYVEPKSRFVVSLVCGVDASTAEEAAAEALLLSVAGEDGQLTTWYVHDRLTGETVEIRQVFMPKLKSGS